MTTVSPNSWNESDQKAIRQQLERILHSGPFHQSQRRQRFLEYLVTETLAGRSDRLKGYNIALEVFDRPETFDPTVYPLVRIEAARLREKLRETMTPTAKAIHSHRPAEGQIHATHRVSAPGCSANYASGGASNARGLLHCSRGRRPSVR